MDTAEWKKYVQRNPTWIEGAFENECGERYLLYRNLNGEFPGNVLYITGDEMDWAIRVPLIPGPLNFSDDEACGIAGILFPSCMPGVTNPDPCNRARGIRPGYLHPADQSPAERVCARRSDMRLIAAMVLGEVAEGDPLNIIAERRPENAYTVLVEVALASLRSAYKSADYDKIKEASDEFKQVVERYYEAADKQAEPV